MVKRRGLYSIKFSLKMCFKVCIYLYKPTDSPTCTLLHAKDFELHWHQNLTITLSALTCNALLVHSSSLLSVMCLLLQTVVDDHLMTWSASCCHYLFFFLLMNID